MSSSRMCARLRGRRVGCKRLPLWESPFAFDSDVRAAHVCLRPALPPPRLSVVKEEGEIDENDDEDCRVASSSVLAL